MYLGHNDHYTSLNGIYLVSNEIIKSNFENSPKVILDLGSRHGEGFLELGINYSSKYIFVEPSPRCISKIEELIKGYPEREFQFIKGILGNSDDSTDLLLFPKDNDYSANLYSKRKRRYGRAKKERIKIFNYSVIEEEIIDFSKINIEAGEYELITSDFFNKIQYFVMEAHNNLIPGKTYKDIIKTLENRYDLTTYGNLENKYSFIIGSKI